MRNADSCAMGMGFHDTFAGLRDTGTLNWEIRTEIIAVEVVSK